MSPQELPIHSDNVGKVMQAPEELWQQYARLEGVSQFCCPSLRSKYTLIPTHRVCAITENAL